MDRKIDKQGILSFNKQKAIKSVALIAVVVLIGSYFMSAPEGKSFKVTAKRLTLSEVKQGAFQEFLPLRGTIIPKRIIYLDAIDGGRVEKVFIEEGETVKAGDKILELSNTNLQLNVLAREADVSEQINNLRNTRLAMEQSRLAKKTSLIEIDYRIKVLKRNKRKSASLLAKKLIAQDDHQQIIDELVYHQSRHEVVKESQVKELELQEQQIAQLEVNVKMLQSNLGISRRSLDNLILKAPISGQLTFLDAEIGESKASGQRLGQVDVLGNFKVTTMVDEFYISRVTKGQTGRFNLGSTSHQLMVSKVKPGVTNGQFEVDWGFVSTPPQGIRRGQTLQIRLELGDTNSALIVDQGGFYQDTGGNWAFVLDEDGNGASKRNVKFGKQNADVMQVVSGLKEGERIITSSYGEFAAMDRLVFQ
jgi:HlyD family secretion protein